MFVVAKYYVAQEGGGGRERGGEKGRNGREKRTDKKKKKERKIKMRARTEKGRSAVSTCRLVGRSVYNKTDTRRRI